MDIANHETNEAMTDPTGIGWMDPNGYEVADKCEFGPQHGTPLGFATDGSPYNQVINGDKYLRPGDLVARTEQRVRAGDDRHQ